MRLTRAQREALVRWIAAGIDSGEINALAAAFDPPFQVTKQNVDNYRKRLGARLKAIKEAGEYDALTQGLALKDERVRKLQQLAAALEADLFGERLWTENVKVIGSFEMAERVEFEEFNKAEVDAYRGVLDDIAKEMGARRQIVDTSGEVTIRVKYQEQDAHGKPKP